MVNTMHLLQYLVYHTVFQKSSKKEAPSGIHRWSLNSRDLFNQLGNLYGEIQ